MVASLLTHRESHFSDPSGGIWREDPFIGGDNDAMVEVMILIGCGLTCRDIAIGHHIQGFVGASSVEQWSIGGHGDAWWCPIVCWNALWSGSASHRSEYMRGVTGVMKQVGSKTVQDGIAAAKGIQHCIGVGCDVKWHVQEYWDDRWYAEAYGAAQRCLGVLPLGTPMDGDTGHTLGCSSPRIDWDTDKRYLMVSTGTHTPNPLLRHL